MPDILPDIDARDISFTKTNELLVPHPDSPRGYVDLFLTDAYLQKKSSIALIEMQKT